MQAVEPSRSLRLNTMTPQQRERRKAFLTASDNAAFLGLSRYKGAADVVAEKLFDLVEAPTTRAARLGQMLHPGIVGWEAEERRIAPVETEVWVEAPNKVMAATLDAVDDERQAAIEGKTSGLLNPHAESSEWGEPETDQIPREYFVQVVSQMISCPTLKVVYVPALRASVGWVSYIIEREGAGVSDLIEWVERETLARWQRHVVNRDPLPPDAPPPTSECLKRFKRVPAKTVNVPAELFEEARAKRALAKTAKDASEDADSRLKFALGDAEAGTCASGVVTFYEQHRKSYVVKESSYRVLRFKGE